MSSSRTNRQSGGGAELVRHTFHVFESISASLTVSLQLLLQLPYNVLCFVLLLVLLYNGLQGSRVISHL